MSQRDLLLDGDSPLRVELQLHPSVSALDRAHAIHNMLSAVFSVRVALSEFNFCVCVLQLTRVTDVHNPFPCLSTKNSANSLAIECIYQSYQYTLRLTV